MCTDECPLRGGILAAIQRLAPLKNGNKHGRYVLQEIFRLRMLEKFGVLLQFIRYLINDETAARRQRIMRFL